MSIIYANSPSRTHVGDAIDSASDGDTVIIPAGTAAWSTILTINKAIHLQGAESPTLDGNSRATNCTTIIQDSMASGAMIVWNLVLNKNSRMSQIKFEAGTRTSFQAEALVQVNGLNTDSRTLRIDHCVFDGLATSACLPFTWVGVFDHNTIRADHQLPFGYVKGNSWNKTFNVDFQGDGSYVDDDNFGTEKFLFIENNNLICTWAPGHVTMIDGSWGSRVVIRYNDITQGSIENHGAEADRGRSGRAGELYMNNFIGNNGGSSVLFSRGGVWVVWGNTITNYNTAVFSLLNDRSREPLFAPIGPCDGRNPWDDNNPSNPFDTATVTTGSTEVVADVSLSVVASAKSWTTNQWAGYTIRRTSGKSVTSLTLVSGFIGTVHCVGHGFSVGDHVSIFGADQYAWNYRYTVNTVTDADHFTFLTNWATTTPATGTIMCCLGAWFAEIYSNTATTLVYNDSVYYAIDTDFPLQLSPGDTFEINKVDAAMDMVGLGSGSDLNGVGVPSLPGGWPDQVSSPNYEWNNTRDGGTDVNFSTGAVGGPHLIIQEGVHYHNNTQKPGYAPYTYPHPLTSNSDSPIITPRLKRGIRKIVRGLRRFRG